MNARMAIDHRDKPRRRWAVGNVNTGSEIKVADRLEKDGLEVYCPRFEALVRPRKYRKNRERETVEKAVFPGYLFVNNDTIANLEAVYDTPGFHYFIRNEDRLSLLHDDAIDALRALEGEGVLLPTNIKALIGQFAAGDLVKVCEGSWGGMVGAVVCVDMGRVSVGGAACKHQTEVAAEILPRAASNSC